MVYNILRLQIVQFLDLKLKRIGKTQNSEPVEEQSKQSLFKHLFILSKLIFEDGICIKNNDLFVCVYLTLVMFSPFY